MPKSRTAKRPTQHKTELQQLRSTLKELQALSREDQQIKRRLAFWEDRLDELKGRRGDAARLAKIDAQRNNKAWQKALDKLNAKRDKERLRALKKTGFFTTKAKTTKLTPGLRRKITDAWAIHGDKFDPKKYFQIAVPKSARSSKKAAQEFKDQARGGSIAIGDNMAFIPRERFTGAKFKFSPKLGRWTIEKERIVTRKEKGRTRRITIKETMPIVSADELLAKEAQIRKRFAGFKPRSESEVLVFSIHGNFSRSSFENIDLLLKNLMKYEKTAERQLDLMQRVVIKRMTLEEWEAHLDDQDVEYGKRRSKRLTWANVDPTGRNTGRKTRKRPRRS